MTLSEAKVEKLWRWPVKGLGGEELAAVTLEEGQLFPFDRAFALENGPSEFDPANPEHVSKRQFICMVKQPESGRLTARFHDASQTLTIEALDGTTLSASSGDAAALEALASKLIHLGVRGPMRLTCAHNLSGGHGFTDVPDRWVSIQNKATIDAVSTELGNNLDPRRLRANILVDGWDAWEEEALVGQKLVMGDVELKIAQVINRCGAIDVNPTNSQRDTDLLRLLKRMRGQLSMGLYARVNKGGSLKPGSPVTVAD
ncbi:MAG: MOSC domain-containing protein [Pseudomonadota bacterium]